MNNSYSINEAAELLQKENKQFVTIIENGNMFVEYYAPKIADQQTPHKKDELYVIASGSSEFIRGKESRLCKTQHG